MMYGGYGIPTSERYKTGLIGKLPTWAWWLIFLVLSVGSSFFITRITANALPSTIGPSAEGGTYWWVHLISGVISVVLFELVAFLYYQIAFMSSHGTINVSKQEFTGMLRAFYCLFLVALGVFQTWYFYNNLAFFFGNKLFGLVGRFLVVLGLYQYLKKYCFTGYTLPRCTLALFLPYVGFELIDLIWSVI